MINRHRDRKSALAQDATLAHVPDIVHRFAGFPLQTQSPFRPMVEFASFWLFWAYTLAWIGTLIAIWTASPDLYHGDSFSDANVLNAAANFERWGMGLNCGLSTHFGTWHPDFPVKPYTHYPPGPEWIHMGLRQLGLRELQDFRVASLIVAGLALVLWRALIWRVTGSNLIALLAVFFYSFCAAFSEYADSLHQHTYMQVTLIASLYCWVRHEGACNRRLRRIWLGLTMFLLFCDLWITFEHILMIPAFVGARAVLGDFRRNWRGALLVGLIPLLALVTRLAHNAVALGDLNTAINDFVASARNRAEGAGEPASIASIAKTWIARLGAFGNASSEFDPGKTIPALKPRTAITLAVLLAWLAWRQAHADMPTFRNGFVFGGTLLFSALLWFSIMRGHSYVHRHLVMLVVPGLSLIMAVAAAGGLWQWRIATNPATRAIGPALALLLLCWYARDFRHSRAGSKVFLVQNEHRTQLAEARTAAESRRRAGITGLANVERIYFVGEMHPELAAQCGIPFVFQLEPPLQPGPRDAIWVEHWSPAEQELARVLLARFGPPDTFGFACRSLVFQVKNRDEVIPVEINYEDSIKVTGIRKQETLDCSSWLIQCLLEIPAHVEGANTTALLDLVGADGASKRQFGVTFAQAQPRGARSIINQIVAKSYLAAGDQFRFSFQKTTPSTALLLPQEPHTAKLPPDAHWEQDLLRFTWNPDESGIRAGTFVTPAVETYTSSRSSFRAPTNNAPPAATNANTSNPK